tara:strand:- start:478 stop:705 length:228 start_codon:yes stop_codon:yes gene_type:complete
MKKPIYESYEVGYEKSASIDYFHEGTEEKYVDKNIYKIVSTKYKEITDQDDLENGLRDWLWRVQVFLRELQNQED